MDKRVFTFHYTVTDKTGEILDSSAESEPLSFLEGAGQIIIGLESQITDLKVGEKKDIHVKAADAYGVRDEQLIVEVARDDIPHADIEVGDVFQGGSEDEPQILTVVAVSTTHVTLDGNHPLAGKDLKFAVDMVGIRPATNDEVMHGHAHDPGGHHH